MNTIFESSKRRSALGLLVILALSSGMARANDGSISGSVVEDRGSVGNAISLCDSVFQGDAAGRSIIRVKTKDYTLIFSREKMNCSIYNNNVLRSLTPCQGLDASACVKQALESTYDVSLLNGHAQIPGGPEPAKDERNGKFVFEYSGSKVESSSRKTCKFGANGIAWLGVDPGAVLLLESIVITDCFGDM